MRYKEIISKKKKIKESQPLMVDDTDTVIDNKITIIEYEDMTDYQKEIIDSGLRPAAGVFPSNLSPDEMSKWYDEQLMKVVNKS